VGPSPVSTAINLTSLTVSVAAGKVSDIQLRTYTQSGAATTCTTGGSSVPIWHATNLTGNFSVAFPTPLMLVPPSGSKMCLGVVTGLNFDGAVVSGSGYFGN